MENTANDEPQRSTSPQGRPIVEHELTPEEWAQAQRDIRAAELEKCSGCEYYDPNGTAEGVGYCGYSSEGWCAR